MKCSTELRVIILTTLTKLFFGVCFIVGSVFRHPDQMGKVYRVCQLFHSSYTVKSWGLIERCYDDLRNGILITGAILFFISIILEAFGINKEFTFRNVAATMIHALGSVFILIASMYQLIVVRNSYRTDVYYYSNSDYIEAGFWIAGGIITAIGQVHLAHSLRVGGRFLICTYLIASLGSIFFVVAGIIISKDVAGNYNYWVYSDHYPPTIAVLLIIGSVLYTVHALLYPFAIYSKVLNLTSLQMVKISNLPEESNEIHNDYTVLEEDSATVSSNSIAVDLNEGSNEVQNVSKDEETQATVSSKSSAIDLDEGSNEVQNVSKDEEQQLP